MRRVPGDLDVFCIGFRGELGAVQELMGFQGPSSKNQQRVANPSSMTETLQSMMRSAAGRTSKRGSSNDGDRHVVNIFVFYSDGRFERFEPA